MSIEARHITKSYGDFKALDDVSLVVPNGELVAILGPSGSGKTTLLKIIAGLEVADLGKDSAILFHDQDVARRGVGERKVGFVFQHYALFKHMNVFENIAFGLRVKPRNERPSNPEIKEKVLELLRLVQLEGRASSYPAQLSGGQRQRVALARALAIQPKVLLLDEPFGALDAKVRQDLRRWLRKLHDEIHVTSLFVTHDQEEALEVADRVVVMRAGRIEQVGTPEEVFHKPANEFVMHFLGDVNLFHGRVETGGKTVIDGVITKEIAKSKPLPADSKLFVRPYDMDIFTTSSNPDDLPVRIVRIQAASSLVKIELAHPTGEPVHVEMPHERYKTMTLAVGQNVFIRPRLVRTFGDDFSI